MTTYTWQRDLVTAGIFTSSADYIALSFLSLSAPSVTIARIICDYDQLLATATPSGTLSESVPTAIGIMLTSAAHGSTVPTPTQGPITNLAGPWLWWQGSPWRPIGPYGSSGAQYGSTGRIDRKVNDTLSTANDYKLWLVAEAKSGSSAFDTHSLAGYTQVLTHPPLT